MKSLLLLLLPALLGTGEASVCKVNPRVFGGEYADIEEFPGMVQNQPVTTDGHKEEWEGMGLELRSEFGAQLKVLLTTIDVSEVPLSSLVVWDHLVYLQKYSPSGYYACAGSLISDQWVLTAAHCVVMEPGYLYLRVYRTKGDDIYIKSTDVIVHEAYDYLGHNDIALIRLPISMSTIDPDFKTIPLPAQDQPLTSNEITLVGWGATSTIDSPSSKHLMKKDHVRLDQDLCSLLPGFSASRNLCFYPTVATGTLCDGDSGGPIYMDGQMVGIVSQSTTLTEVDSQKSLFIRTDTRVSAYRNWIDSKISSYTAALETTLE